MGQSKLKKNNEVMRLIIILAIVIVAIVALVLLSATKSVDKSDYTEIRFNNMYDTEGTSKVVSQKLKVLDGQKVFLSGYMAEQSPVDGSFIYLVNQPYVVCPFCTVGDITKLEIMTILMADGSSISFRTNAVSIYGTLEVAPKVDSFGYTTQFRILADRIENIEESEDNSEVNSYYNSLNQNGMIFDIQTLQMNIDGVTNTDTMNFYYKTTDAIPVIDAMKDNKSLDFDYYKQYFISKWDSMKASEGFDFDSYKAQLASQGIDMDNLSGAQAYLMYIKECPDIIASLRPDNENLAKLNDELIEIYNKEIPIMEAVMEIVSQIKTTEMNDEQKIESFNKLLSYKDENLKLFDEFTKWNNKLRE